MRRLVVALLVLTAQAAHAQQPDTLVLTLEQGLEIARRNNPAYIRAANQVGLNGAETRSALFSGVLPSVSLNLLNTGYTGNLSRRATDNFGNPIANPNAEYVYFSNTRQGLGLSWQLRGPQPWYRIKRIGVENQRRQLGEDVAGETLRLELRRRFFDALEQDELLAAEAEIGSAMSSDLETAQRLFELALKSRLDVLQAELQIEEQQLAQRRQRGVRDQARLALASMLGQSDLPPVRPAPTEVPLFDPSGLDEEALVGRAVAVSSDVRQANAELRSAELAVDESRTSYWPTLSADFNVGRLEQGPDRAGLFGLGGFGDDMYSSFSVALSLPFFNSPFTNQLMVSRAQVARENGQETLREARLAAEQEARSALLALRNSWDELGIRERSLAIATEALELAREEYRLGARTFEQLQQSIRSEADTRRLLIQARYRFADALTDLEAAVGGPVR
jgi:outer membrane protein